MGRITMAGITMVSVKVSPTPARPAPIPMFVVRDRGTRGVARSHRTSTGLG